MKRHYYICDNVADLETIENQLKSAGIETPQLHVYSPDAKAAEVGGAAVHEVTDFTKRDVIRSGFIGVGIGAIGALLVLGSAYAMGWVQSGAGWTPFVFAALVVLGFSTWAGGFRGIQEPNQEFLKFEQALNRGKHIFYIDVDSDQEATLSSVVSRFPQLEFAGDGSGAPAWLIHSQTQFQRFIKAMP
ncbi:MAG: NAD/FAD-utilizing enzyme [Gammaproteobacteria bacterium]|nr:NAD/FAD-utilizing enzyme [Gammaproteobacteria bacterium]MBT8150708.1 NAD/FAD-utilizing enzyme [Gammaproteobacteria bacterium]NND38832.1 NAD/FAD-utilizing enzyme [Pseudomonadales bacterium]NNM10473.1 NAD/FAD-utilizing enzyme [Pseudomonadales bacterium]RZV49824.1 MAG: NAD/FAD-utilizing enzyme [Pseudomonadales bacterium]